MEKLTTIAITKQTRDDLKKFGTKDETYDHILEKVMELAKKELFYDRQKRILETEEFVPLEKI